MFHTEHGYILYGKTDEFSKWYMSHVNVCTCEDARIFKTFESNESCNSYNEEEKEETKRIIVWF